VRGFIFGGMKTILLGIVIAAFAVFTSPGARAQDAATQQQIDKLSGQIQDIQDAQALQSKRMDALEKEISDLSNKLNQPSADNYASADDLKKLAEQVQELAKKQQDDNDQILKALEKLGHSAAPMPVPTTNTSSQGTETQGPSGTQKGYYYPIASGDTLSAIAKAYRAQGVKVTTDQILKANPGLNPNNMTVGKKIFIPDPNAP